jgi:aquaporin SIP
MPDSVSQTLLLCLRLCSDGHLAAFIYGSSCLFVKFCCIRSGYQVIGAVIGVKLIQLTFPSVGKGARLSVGAHHGALAEGLATFMVVMVSVTLKKKEMKSFFMKTWITSIWKNTIHILSSDITGGIMNPASVSFSTHEA